MESIVQADNKLSCHECLQQLYSKYDIVDVVDCDLYGNEWTDLYINLKQIHKPEYANNERIIIKTTYDFYNKNDKNGKILQSLQTIINDIDISNFFICLVTTNENIHKEYQKVLKTYSVDQIPFNIYTCSGDFTRKSDANVNAFRKIESMHEQFNTVDNLDEEEKKLLFKSNTFCIAPWTSLMISTDNQIRPCCEYQGIIGDAKKSSLEQAWNSSELQNIRRKMLNDQQVDGCKECYLKQSLGRDTLRNSLNRRFSKHISKIKQTNAHGYLDNFELVYLDSRFNNLCNLSCRSCGHHSSSAWHKPAVKLGLIAKDTPIFLSAGRSDKDLLDQILMHIDSIESIYFAGGEPLIIEDFYHLVDELDKRNRHDVKLIYNTNLTKNQLKGRSIFDLWKNFKHISIGASLDAEGTRGEYLRCGTKWQDVVDFRKEIIEKRPDIDFSISATTSIINALHVPDFHRSWVEQNLITADQFNIQLLFTPEYMSLNTAPVRLKEKIKAKYEKHLNWLQPLDRLGRATFGFESLVKQLDNNIDFDRKLFWDNVKLLDGYYKTDLISVFPELEVLK